ncbi:MAG: hypothetical protein M1836_001589 [Candelina mexicana]|nr:MAG: hypothetical protein M1836_001589 [Candelina mexicana]
MSSPSSSGSVKRKRSSTLPTSIKKSSTADLQQPSSRDASGEDGGDSAVPEASAKLKKTTTSAGTNPPSKRTRKTSSAAEPLSNAATSIPSISQQDPGEPSDTTDASTDIATRTKRKGLRSSSGKRNIEDEDTKDVDGDSEQSMPPVRKVLADPVGFHTNPPPTGRAVRVYADGVFDLFHLGHMRQLEQAKNAFPDTYLLVGVTGDRETHKRKGLTVLSGAERAETVRHCKWVDEVIEDCPWIVTTEFLEEHKIDYVAHDDLPYGADEGDDIYKPIKEQGKFLVTQRTEGVSTTGIITKIVRDYEKYIARQLKRGTSRQELNISWLKKHEMDLRNHVTELRNSIRNNWSTTGQELGKEFSKYWPPSRPASPARGISQNNTLDVPGAAKASGGSSPGALAHLSHLDIPRPDSPSGGGNSDFAAGYSLGLIGGVRSWMMRSRTSVRGSAPGSSESEEEDSGPGSPGAEKTPSRGREGQKSEESMQDAMDTKG